MQRSDFTFFFELPVRWGDMDAYGHVNNVAYLRYFESARIGYMEHLRDRFGFVHEPHQRIILADIQCAFRQQLHYPAELEIGQHTSRIGSSSFDLSGAIYRRGEEQAVATSKAVLVWFDFATQRPAALSPALRDILERA